MIRYIIRRDASSGQPRAVALMLGLWFGDDFPSLLSNEKKEEKRKE